MPLSRSENGKFPRTVHLNDGGTNYLRSRGNTILLLMMASVDEAGEAKREEGNLKLERDCPGGPIMRSQPNLITH